MFHRAVTPALMSASELGRALFAQRSSCQLQHADDASTNGLQFCSSAAICSSAARMQGARRNNTTTTQLKMISNNVLKLLVGNN